MLQRVIVLLSIAVLASYTAAKEKEELKIGDPAPKFTLKDADDKEYSLETLLDKETKKIIILIMGDRKARKQGDKWAIELDKIYGKKEEIVILMVADLRDLPFFVTEGMVKWGVKREKIPVPILLDWGGKVNELYKTQKGKPDLFIIDSDGTVSDHQVGAYSDELTKKVQDGIEKALSSKNSAIKGRRSLIMPRVYVLFWFDVEDYITPQSDDALKKLVV
jgi:peroxiredoxin